MSLSRTFLAAAWLLPCIALLLASLLPPDIGPLLPSAVGVQDSGRLLLFCGSLAAYLLSKRLGLTGTEEHLGSLFLFWVAISTLFSEAPFDSFLFSQTWLAAGFFFLAFRRIGGPMHDLPIRLLLVHLPVFMIATAALLPLLFRAEAIRVGGVFELPGVLANWLVLLLPLLLHDALTTPSRYAVPAGLTCVLSLTTVGFTLSRGGWLLGALELALILFLLRERGWKRLLATTGFLLLGCGLLVALRGALSVNLWMLCFGLLLSLPSLHRKWSGASLQTLSRLFGILLLSALVLFALSPGNAGGLQGRAAVRLESLRTEDNSTRARLELWRAALSMTLEHPILGVGPGNFSLYYPRHQRYFYYYSDSPHSAALELSSETGLPGLLLFTAFLLTVCRKAVASGLDSSQRAALLGLLCGLAYAQIEVGYQFAYLWLTVAALCGYLLPLPPKAEAAGRLRPASLLLVLACVLAAGYLYPPLRRVELASRDPLAARAAALVEGVSERLPWWRRGLTVSFQKRLEAAPDDPSLAEDLDKLLNLGAGSATAHALAGEYLSGAGRPAEALRQYEASLDADPLNNPYVYRGLHGAALATGQQSLADQTLRRLLELYDLESLERAPDAHQASLEAQLVPMLYNIADSLNPYYHPEKTEPIYRYLVSVGGGPRAAHGLGISLWTQGRHEEALPYLERAHRANPLFPPPPALPGGLR